MQLPDLRFKLDQGLGDGTGEDNLDWLATAVSQSERLWRDMLRRLTELAGMECFLLGRHTGDEAAGTLIIGKTFPFPHHFYTPRESNAIPRPKLA